MSTLLAASAPLNERLLVAATGPLVTVLVGGLLVWAITSTVQRRRETADRALQHAREDGLRVREEARSALVRDQDTHRADDALRHEIVQDMTAAAGTLYLAGQQYWRAKEDVSRNQADADLLEAKKRLRTSLDETYLSSRAEGVVIEGRLEGFFVSTQPRDLWHQVMDLLTVRYFQLIDRDTEKLYTDNEGAEHTRLTMAEMLKPKLLLSTYHRALRESVRSVFDEPLRARS